jgi:hypothetical protein
MPTQAQTEGRGIHGISNPFTNLAQAGDGQSEQRPGHFTLGKDTVYIEKFRKLDTQVDGRTRPRYYAVVSCTLLKKNFLSVDKNEKPILTEVSAITCTAAVRFQAEGIIAGHRNPILYNELFNGRY